MWRAQILPHFLGAGLYGYLDGSIPAPEKLITAKDKDGKEQDIPNPAYEAWVRQDQQVLGHILSNLTRDVLVSVDSIKTAHAMWTSLGNMFASQSRSRINNIRIALANAQKGTQSASVYFGRMRSLADELAAAGRPLEEDELLSFIIAGLDLDYNSIVSALDARTEPVTVDFLYSAVCNFDQRVELFTGGVGGTGGFKSSANLAARRGGPPPSQQKQNGGGYKNQNRAGVG